MKQYLTRAYAEYIAPTQDEIEDLREQLPTDQRAELHAGQHVTAVWFGYSGGQGGSMLLLHDQGRGAICFGAQSEWGDWTPGETCNGELSLDSLDDGGDRIIYRWESASIDEYSQTEYEELYGDRETTQAVN